MKTGKARRNTLLSLLILLVVIGASVVLFVDKLRSKITADLNLRLAERSASVQTIDLKFFKRAVILSQISLDHPPVRTVLIDEIEIDDLNISDLIKYGFRSDENLSVFSHAKISALGVRVAVGRGINIPGCAPVDNRILNLGITFDYESNLGILEVDRFWMRAPQWAEVRANIGFRWAMPAQLLSLEVQKNRMIAGGVELGGLSTAESSIVYLDEGFYSWLKCVIGSEKVERQMKGYIDDQISSASLRSRFMRAFQAFDTKPSGVELKLKPKQALLSTQFIEALADERSWAAKNIDFEIRVGDESF